MDSEDSNRQGGRGLRTMRNLFGPLLMVVTFLFLLVGGYGFFSMLIRIF